MKSPPSPNSFTPGPWRLEKHAKLGDTQMYWVNDFTSVGTQIPEDAALIAAAPAMFEALVEAVEEIEQLRKFAGDNGAMIDEIEFVEGRNALNQARGL